MKRISIFFAAFLILSLGFYVSSYAQSSQDSVDSDYLRDIKFGEEQIKDDSQAKALQKEIIQSEKPQAQVESQPVTASETVSAEEAKENKEDLQPEDNNETIEFEIQEDQKNTPEPTESPIESPAPTMDILNENSEPESSPTPTTE